MNDGISRVSGFGEIHVVLTPVERAIAELVAHRRHSEAVRDGRRDANGLDGAADGFALHIAGAMGEMAVAKARGVYWDGAVGTFKAPDLGRAVQVRTRAHHWQELIVRPDDNLMHAYILVTGSAEPDFLRLRGWCWGHEATRPEWFKPHGKRPEAYFVPHNRLRPMLRREASQHREAA